MAGQPGFFDGDERPACKRSAAGDPPERLAAVVDFAPFRAEPQRALHDRVPDAKVPDLLPGIRARTGEGRGRAKARGIRLGRKPKLTAHQEREAIRRRDELGEPVREIARSYNVSHPTISRLSL